MLQALTLAVSAAAVSFIPALAGLIPALRLIFTGDDDDIGTEALTEMFTSKMNEVINSIGDKGDASGAASKDDVPGADAVYKAQKDLAEFLTKKRPKSKDDKMEHFFGLERLLAKEGVAYTTPGTPTWLCPDCRRGLHPHDGSRTAQHLEVTLERESRTHSYGITLDHNTDDMLLVLPVSQRRYLPVVDVASKGPAESKLQKGDHILAIGGKFVSEFQDYTAVKFALTEGTKLELKIERL